jgi:6,7-dimethyl-8-ribityllumazine synthase
VQSLTPASLSLIPVGSSLRVAIVHARWNPDIVDPLVASARSALISSGVPRQNIVIDSVPGSYELPFACQKVIAASQIQASSLTSIAGVATGSLTSATQDLLGSSTSDLKRTALDPADATATAPVKGRDEQDEDAGSGQKASSQPFDAVIAIGVLIKGETMHFEYISDAVSHGLMRAQLDSGVPVIFGLLTVLNQEQGLTRAGMNGGHNHGEDWGNAAVELASKRKRWAEGRLS